MHTIDLYQGVIAPEGTRKGELKKIPHPFHRSHERRRPHDHGGHFSRSYKKEFFITTFPTVASSHDEGHTPHAIPRYVGASKLSPPRMPLDRPNKPMAAPSGCEGASCL